jgi:hypothetical protein
MILLKSDKVKFNGNLPIWFYLISFIFSFGCTPKEDSYLIIIPEEANYQEKLAAKEIRRYLYARTGELLRIERKNRSATSFNKAIILSDLKHYSLNKEFNETNLPEIKDISSQGYMIQKRIGSNSELLWIIGGSDFGVLYGAYHFLENMGIGFYLHDDVIPDEKIDLIIPDLNISRNPLFDIRGILPFHDFPEGPDWWELDDYKAIIGQLPKMGMNFIGLHTYPESDYERLYKAEPLVWIGMEEDVLEDGSVKSGYPVLHFNTKDTTWGYLPRKTSSFFYGADRIFDKEFFGTEYMDGISQWPHTGSENIDIFNKSGQFFNTAFSFAQMLGVKTCIGTESALTIPENLGFGLKNQGLELNDPQTIKNLYKGIFNRINKTYPIDYYWLWTPEQWTWSDISASEVSNVKQDLQIAYEALQEINSPFQLATCGWVLGPPTDRAEFDKILSKNIPFSCINREVGFSPVEPAFNNISERALWAIPWLEDDPAMISPQLWVGRIRKDAYDAYNYGCDGLMGIHWRTINVAPMASALAKAAWEMGDWINKEQGDRDLDAGDLYQEWASKQFGKEYADEIAEIFTSIDGGPLYISGKNERESKLYRTSDWNKGPGGLRIAKMNTDVINAKYAFIEDLVFYMDKIQGISNKERLLYWIHTFKYSRNTAILGNTLFELDSLMILVLDHTSYVKKKEFIIEHVIPKRILANKNWQNMVHQLLSVVQTKGEMGTVANLQQHNMDYLALLTKYDAQIISISGEPLPASALPDQKYSGPDRIIVSTRRTMITKSEDFKLKIIVLSEDSIKKSTLCWRKLGAEKYKKRSIDFIKQGHGICFLKASEFSNSDFEYYLTVELSKNDILRFPTAAPESTRIIIINPD